MLQQWREDHRNKVTKIPAMLHKQQTANNSGQQSENAVLDCIWSPAGKPTSTRSSSFPLTVTGNSTTSSPSM